MSILHIQGIVLKHTNIGEADKILTILTRGKGKIKAIAKGCRKPRSSLLSSCEVFVFSEFVLYKGANFYHVTQAETKEAFYNIRKDLLKLSYGAFFIEIADYVTDEDIPSEKLFLLLANVLHYLAAGEFSVGLLSLAYQLKLMDISGFRPNISRCVNCKKKEDSYGRFSTMLGGVLCSSCSELDSEALRISPGTLEFAKILLNTQISRLNTLKIDNTIFNELDKITREFVRSHLEKDFKSLSFLDEIKDSNQ
ncbi:MAG: DNA repair protein RecO [Bacillota bacterium]